MNVFDRWKIAVRTLERVRADEDTTGGEPNYNWKVQHRLRLEAAIKDELFWREKAERLLATRRGK